MPYRVKEKHSNFDKATQEAFAKARQVEYDKRRDESPERQFLHSMEWRRISRAKLDRDPLCERCMKQGRIVAAVLVHHSDENQLNNYEENLKSLCNDCHEEIHKSERFGNSGGVA